MIHLSMNGRKGNEKGGTVFIHGGLVQQGLGQRCTADESEPFLNTILITKCIRSMQLSLSGACVMIAFSCHHENRANSPILADSFCSYVPTLQTSSCLLAAWSSPHIRSRKHDAGGA